MLVRMLLFMIEIPKNKIPSNPLKITKLPE
jgi:hypothetical protein